jgi:two-component system, NtrC family, nitrogen regulation sensor histidine kinase NtrY
MIFKRIEWRIFIRVSLLLLVSFGIAYVVLLGFYPWLVLIVPVLGYLLLDLYKFQRKAQDEVDQFVEAVHYRDFSRYFDVKHAPLELQPLRQGFNEINSTFKVISKEKETQYQYLQKILELVDTGILSYEEEGGGVGWMNESLKQMLETPYLKTIHSLKKRDEALYEAVLQLKPGETRIASARLEKSTFKVLLSATAFQTEGKKFKLIAFQNINEAIDETESKAWQRLLSVMTHEIMNSIAPISSLADTLRNRVLHAKANPGEDSLDDLDVGIETIKRRSEGLLRFAETYRNLNKILKPDLRKNYVIELFNNLQLLMQPTLSQKGIQLDIILPDPLLTVEADTNLLEQVLINLLVNAIEAVKEQSHPRIVLSGAALPHKKTMMRISDNGAGMPEEVLEKIFIPFFSTKKNGSGIGLSLCKQIMLLHHGSIVAQSKVGEGSSFSLTL